jgi:hypothetical protein
MRKVCKYLIFLLISAVLLTSALAFGEKEDPRKGTLGATTGVPVTEECNAGSERSGDVSCIKSPSFFTPEMNNGAHYYAGAEYSSKYQEAFANIKLPTSYNNASNNRNGCIAFGIYGSVKGIDMGLKNEGSGWFPVVYDPHMNTVNSAINAEHRFTTYTAPSTATNAIITVNPVSVTSVRMYVQFKDANGNNVGTTFDQTIDVAPGNLTADNAGNILCRFYRFASLIPVSGYTDNLQDSSYMLGGEFTNAHLYNRQTQSYETWGIYTNRVVSAWIVYPTRCWLSCTTTGEAFTIDHWSASKYASETAKDVMARINAEYGTGFRQLTAEEIELYGIEPVSTNTLLTPDQILEFESLLRHQAEKVIPEIERITEEARAVSESLARSRQEPVRQESRAAIYATTPIQYATAAATGYTYLNNYSQTLWSSCSDPQCLTDFQQLNWFMALAPSASVIDRGRNIFWEGAGLYGITYNGSQYPEASGTQYAYMNIASYA